jgi:membrane protein YdbS with pleckstrin-like domain
MKQLDPRAVWLFFWNSIGSWIFTVLFLAFWGWLMTTDFEVDLLPEGIGLWLALVAILALVGCFLWAKLTFHYYRYELTERGFRKESGVIWKRYVTIPYNRIQNVDIYRGILARVLGLSDLQIQTAGASASVSRYGAWGMGAEGRLQGLSKEDAERLRDELVDRARASSTGSGV